MKTVTRRSFFRGNNRSRGGACVGRLGGAITVRRLDRRVDLFLTAGKMVDRIPTGM